MNCEVAKDLMTLYVEDMCSLESKKALEEHVKECPACAEALKSVKKELEIESIASKSDYTGENASTLQPMKKVKKSLVRRKRIAILLGFLLIAVLTGIGFLSYGQVTNRCMSFSAIADAFKVKRVCEKLTEGDTQALLDVIAFQAEETYSANKGMSVGDGMEEYKKAIQKSMDEAYAYYFQGKDIRVKIEEVELTPYEEIMPDDYGFLTYIIGFYENEKRIYLIEFNKITPKKYILYEVYEEGKPNFAANLRSYEGAVLDVFLRHTTSRIYNELIAGEKVSNYASGLAMGIRGTVDADGQQAFSDGLKQRLKELYESGWYFKDVMFAADEFDTEKKHWIYKVWFLSENQEDGTLAMLEQRFAYYNSHLYVMEEEEPTVMVQTGEVPEEIRTQLTNLFR